MKAVGARLPRYDGIEHVTGRTIFVDDVRVSGMLWAKALRSPVHSAEIKGLDTSKAEAMPGVHAVVTWKDVPLLEYGHLSALGIPADEPLLAKDEVRYKGQPIAIVAAEDEETASAAVDAIDLDLEERDAALRHPPRVRRRRARRSTSGATGTPTSRTRWTAARSGRARSTTRSTRPTRSSRASTGRPRSSTCRSRRRSRSSSPRRAGG